MWGRTDIRVLRCRGCETAYVQKVDEDSEDQGEPRVSHWPAPSKRSRPLWLTHGFSQLEGQLQALAEEVYTALDADLRVLAAIGIRTAFDRASELLGVDPGLGFAAKLKGLQEAGKISPDERDILDSLTNAGHAAAHRGWRPSPMQLSTMMDIIEAFLHRSFVLGAAARELRTDVPARGGGTGRPEEASKDWWDASGAA